MNEDLLHPVLALTCFPLLTLCSSPHIHPCLSRPEKILQGDPRTPSQDPTIVAKEAVNTYQLPMDSASHPQTDRDFMRPCIYLSWDTLFL